MTEFELNPNSYFPFIKKSGRGRKMYGAPANAKYDVQYLRALIVRKT